MQTVVPIPYAQVELHHLSAWEEEESGLWAPLSVAAGERAKMVPRENLLVPGEDLLPEEQRSPSSGGQMEVRQARPVAPAVSVARKQRMVATAALEPVQGVSSSY